jgi:RNA-splicing ligase RtcB
MGSLRKRSFGIVSERTQFTIVLVSDDPWGMCSATPSQLAERGIIIKSPSMRGVAEEAPGAYKDVSTVVAAAEQAGLARRVARLRPLICIKG